MELMSGYKRTEAGVIPDNWDIMKIGEVSRLVNGRGFKPHEWCDNGLPIIRIQNLNGSEVFNYYAGEFNSKILVEHGQLLFAWSGSRGTSFGPHIWTGSKALLNYHTWKIVTNDSKIDGDYFYHALRSLTNYIEDSAHGASALVHTQKGEMEKYDILVPPIQEQRAIATAISDLDALIASLDRMIAKKRDMKQATMQELLTGKRRLSGFSGEWEIKTLGELFTFKNGLNKGKEYFGYGTPIVNYMDVFGNSSICSDSLKGRVSVTKTELLNFDVQTGDVFFTRTSETTEEIGIAAVILGDPIDTVFSGFILRGRPINDSLCDSYKAYCFQSIEIRKQIISKASYTTRALTNGKLLSSVKIQVPSKTEQTAIAMNLSDMDADIATMEQKLEKTRMLKQGMMQELLTGRIRLV